MGREAGDGNGDGSRRAPSDPRHVEKGDMKLWGVLLFGFIGASITAMAVCQLRNSFDWFYTQLMSESIRKKTASGPFRNVFQEEARRRYQQQLREEYEEELQRVERIRRMQNIFNMERNKFGRGYERWREYGPETYHQHFQHDGWYWYTDAYYRHQWFNPKEPLERNRQYSLSHHYSVLGLDRWRSTPYSEAEIKKAFRAKAMEFHPDQHQNNKEAAAEKFREVVMSYEAIKQERRDIRL